MNRDHAEAYFLPSVYFRFASSEISNLIKDKIEGLAIEQRIQLVRDYLRGEIQVSKVSLEAVVEHFAVKEGICWYWRKLFFKEYGPTEDNSDWTPRILKFDNVQKFEKSLEFNEMEDGVYTFPSLLMRFGRQEIH